MDALTVYLISRYCCPFLYKEGWILSSLGEVSDRVVGKGQETDHPRRKGIMPYSCALRKVIEVKKDCSKGQGPGRWSISWVGCDLSGS